MTFLSVIANVAVVSVTKRENYPIKQLPEYACKHRISTSAATSSNSVTIKIDKR